MSSVPTTAGRKQTLSKWPDDPHVTRLKRVSGCRMSTSKSSYWTEVSCVVSLGICNVLYVGGLVMVARLLFPVLSPAASAAQVAAYFATHHDAIRTGALMMTL